MIFYTILIFFLKVSERADDDVSMHSVSEGNESEMDELESDFEADGAVCSGFTCIYHVNKYTN